MPRLEFVLIVALSVSACKASVGVETDSGPADSGVVVDEGVAVDSGSAADATEVDLGPGLDASTVDADEVDLGTPDLGSTDTGLVDAGPPDSGPPPGCAIAMPLAPGQHSFQLEGLTRNFIVHVPRNYTDARLWPVVLALHPNGSNIGYWNDTQGQRNLRSLAEDSTILVVAEGVDGNWRNYGLDSGTWGPQLEQDLRYFDEVMNQVQTGLCVDPDAITAIGFSGGGSFAGVLGCRRNWIRAFAAGGAVNYFTPADCINTAAAWVTIGMGEFNNGRAGFRDHFRDDAGCLETSTATTPAPCVAYDGCGASTPVHYCEHPGGHRWPDFGTAAAWAFLARFGTPGGR